MARMTSVEIDAKMHEEIKRLQGELAQAEDTIVDLRVCAKGLVQQRDESVRLRDDLATRVLRVPFRGADVKPVGPYLLLDDVLQAISGE